MLAISGCILFTIVTILSIILGLTIFQSKSLQDYFDNIFDGEHELIYPILFAVSIFSSIWYLVIPFAILIYLIYILTSKLAKIIDKFEIRKNED